MNFRQILLRIHLYVLTKTTASAQYRFGNYALQHVIIIDVNTKVVLKDNTTGIQDSFFIAEI